MGNTLPWLFKTGDVLPFTLVHQRGACPLFLPLHRFQMITWCYPDLMDKDEWRQDFAEPIMQGGRLPAGRPAGY